jgi:DNA mismatch endonuclease (patch repair protein)
VRTTIETNKARSAQMALIKARDTKPELKVRRAMHAAGLRFRLYAQNLPGRPDLVFPSRRIAVFVHGCFWHQHPDPNCKLARMPKSRLEFWRPKLEGNRQLDLRKCHELEAQGWFALEVWECQTGDNDLEALAVRIRQTPACGHEKKERSK